MKLNYKICIRDQITTTVFIMNIILIISLIWSNIIPNIPIKNDAEKEREIHVASVKIIYAKIKICYKYPGMKLKSDVIYLY